MQGEEEREEPALVRTLLEVEVVQAHLTTVMLDSEIIQAVMGVLGVLVMEVMGDLQAMVRRGLVIDMQLVVIKQEEAAGGEEASTQVEELEGEEALHLVVGVRGAQQEMLEAGEPLVMLEVAEQLDLQQTYLLKIVSQLFRFKLTLLSLEAADLQMYSGPLNKF